MSTVDKEATIRQRVEERPSFELKKVREVRMRDLGYRFIAGALTSVAAGAVTLVFGARTGGILLAFPAILAASLTLIEEQENSAEAREDARGAVMGGLALGLFAAVAALAFGALSGALALLLAAVTWLVVAVVGYALAWLG
ncbi:MAG: DUF3147 family protein [Solirubrobacterales bacterium]|nr:DUF3147 family protein [Solirubrobacterales bacterium]